MKPIKECKYHTALQAGLLKYLIAKGTYFNPTEAMLPNNSFHIIFKKNAGF